MAATSGAGSGDEQVTPWRKLVLPLGVCGLGILFGAFLKGAGKVSVLETVLLFAGYVLFIVILGLAATAISRSR
jgi:hypothetical protein